MPKKKDKRKGDKKDEERKTSKKDISATEANKTGSDDKEKNLYLIQIRHLNERLETYQLKCDQLESQKKDLNSRCHTLETEKKDIVEYLKRSLLEKEDEVEELTERLEGQRQAADEDREALLLQHSQLRQELQDQIEEVTSRNVTMAGRLAALEDFQKQRDQLMSHVESLEEQLANQMEEHKAEIHSLEMKALLEKRSLEKEMESHMAAMAAKVQHQVDQRVPERTRLALQENMEVKAQLSQLSEQAQVLVAENSTLRGHKSRLGVDVDILEQLFSETTRQSCIRKKAVEQLTEKCQQLQAELKDCRQELEQLQTEHRGVLAETKALRQGQASLSEQCSKNRTKGSRLEEDLREERRRRSRMKMIMQEAAFTLREALMEAPTEPDCEVDSVLRWKQLMQRLLLVLDRPKPTDPQSENEVRTSDPAATRNRPDDPGLVTCPTPKHKPVFSRMGAPSSSSNMPLHRKPFGQRSASSINSTESAVRFLTSKVSFTKHK